MSDSPTKTKTNDYEIRSPLENANAGVLSAERNEVKASLPRDPTTLSHLTEVIEAFNRMNLREPLLRGIYGYGLEHPTGLQQRALKPCISGYDVIAQAQSGTGKTITFIIAVLQQLNVDCKECQALILAPTRELAQGIRGVVLALGEYMNVTCHACIGGVKLNEDIKQFEAGVQVVISTPGRIYDMLKRSALRSENIKMFVLDELDELLSCGFNDPISDVFTMLPANVQVIVASTTMPYDLTEITAKFMNDPVKVIIKREERTLEGIRQFYVNVEREEYKLDTLCDLLDMLTITKVVIFCNSCRKVEWLTEKLCAYEPTVSALHLNMDLKQRNDVIREFRMGSSRILVRADTVTENIDVACLSLIINYELPIKLENYLHRLSIGRTGAVCQNGMIINFISNDEQDILYGIEQYYNTKIAELPMDIANLI